MVTTQLGGKFSREDNGLFILKQKLKSTKLFNINYPTGDGIVADHNGIPLTFDPKVTSKSFYDIEIDYMRSIKSCDIHIVYNSFKDQTGYIGESASVEIAYAIIHNKSVILMYKPVFSDKVPDLIKEVIGKQYMDNRFLIAPIHLMTPDEIIKFFDGVTFNNTNYDVNVLEEAQVLMEVEKLLKSYKQINLS